MASQDIDSVAFALQKLHLHKDEAVVEYIRELINDEPDPDAPAEQTVTEFLLGSTDADPALVQSVARSLLDTRCHLKPLKDVAATPLSECNESSRDYDSHVVCESAETLHPSIRDLIIGPAPPTCKSHQDSGSNREYFSSEPSTWNPKTRMKDTMKQRIVEQYAVQFDDTLCFDEEGHIQSELKEAGISTALAAPSAESRRNSMPDDIPVNDNRAKVLRAAQEQRKAAKLLHEQEVARNKLLKQQQLQAKEKEKKRVGKKERRTGH